MPCIPKPREPALEAIKLRKALKIEPTREGIKQFRKTIFSLPPEHPARYILMSPDFYSVSGTRDLLFHAHEYNFTVPELAETIQRAGLRILEFGASTAVRAKFQSLGFTDFSDLKAWEEAEKRRPALFSRMYSVIVGHV